MYTYKLFILDWDTADEQRHDSFRGTAKTLSAPGMLTR